MRDIKSLADHAREFNRWAADKMSQGGAVLSARMSPGEKRQIEELRQAEAGPRGDIAAIRRAGVQFNILRQISPAAADEAKGVVRRHARTHGNIDILRNLAPEAIPLFLGPRTT
jgi:hypothetical protein